MESGEKECVPEREGGGAHAVTSVKLLTDRESEVGVRTTQHLSARSAIW